MFQIGNFIKNSHLNAINKRIFFKILVFVRNVSLSPNDNPLTIKEGTTIKVTCSVNSDAYPTPVIQWYIGDTEIGNNNETLELTADKIHDGKILHCLATNYNKSLSSTTNLNILCKLYLFDEL